MSTIEELDFENMLLQMQQIAPDTVGRFLRTYEVPHELVVDERVLGCSRCGACVADALWDLHKLYHKTLAWSVFLVQSFSAQHLESHELLVGDSERLFEASLKLPLNNGLQMRMNCEL